MVNQAKGHFASSSVSPRNYTTQGSKNQFLETFWCHQAHQKAHLNYKEALGKIFYSAYKSEGHFVQQIRKE